MKLNNIQTFRLKLLIPYMSSLLIFVISTLWCLYLYKKNEHFDLLLSISLTFLFFNFILFLFYLTSSKKLQIFLSSTYNKLQSEIGDRKIIQEALTENKQRLEQLIDERDFSLGESKKRYQTLFDKTADALLIIEGSKFVDCNQATLDMLGYETKEELFNLHPSKLSPEFQPDGQASEVKANFMIETAFERGSHRFEWNHLRKNGDVFPVEVLLTSIPFEDTQLLHVVWRDITKRKEAAAEIAHQAYYDSLTELPNRRLLLDRLKQALITCRRHNYYGALLFVDLDRFKTINDSLGHSIGDRLLIESAKRIKASIWDEDTAARFGGDEYVILLRHLGNDKEAASLTAKKISTRIQDAFKRVFLIKGHELHVSTSIGISLFPFKDQDIEDIIKNADTAMCSAKENGRDQIAFYLSKMHEKVLKRLTLEKDLRHAIKESQLDVYYQPQLNNQGKTIAVEALIRWQHPEHGFVNPEEFIAIAEDIGLIYEIGDFVIQKSILDITSVNKEQNISIGLSVNISPHQFKKSNFVGLIKSIMENHQLEKHFLTLEVTEGIAIDNLNDTIEKFKQLRHVGVKLSLDDFGTGYSSLSHLKRLPIDELKIDKSFVFDLEEDPQDALLVKTIINISHQFGLETVAEGVETKEQLEFLKSENCTIYQGYYYSRPLPIDQLREFLDANLK
jgi:diguanylate cyclase (GGDEF)-like protein/PAS domain S-box-containing protein